MLDRARRLRHVARSARQSAVQAVGVPADCDPAALARVIRAGAERGTTLGVRELPPDERVAGLADGSLAYALVRVPPEHAALRVPLGLASAPPHMPDGMSPDPAVARRRPAPRPVHLEDLRPRRGRGAPRGQHASVPILTMAEDQVPYAQDRLRRAAARAGLPEALVRPAGPVATALAETLAGRGTLLCAEPFARRHGASWAPLGDGSLHRGYDASAAPRQREGEGVPGWLVALLVAAVGAVRAGWATAASDAAGGQAPSRLAARG
ncbi:LysR family transcriptional regulator [Streptomyces sp. NPDC047079]|uniref:LysR family transcriptional regulator n=1 Tax=Streptomyces sp. NPDC047079 TaxID=3154607 RepID=UPI0033E12A0D